MMNAVFVYLQGGKMPKVAVGLSGGVDSAVAAYLLKKEGYDVTGVILRTWEGEEPGRCCDIDDARSIAERLGVPFRVINCAADFEKKVTQPFMESYTCGRTPNPCVGCNRAIKWEYLIYAADVIGAEYVATGHYAHVIKLENGRYTVRTADHAEKDQTYMLCRLSQEQLARTLMPLGAYSKDQVRSIAAELGLSVADKPDSQEICFVPEGRYAEYIEKHYSGELPKEGNFVSEDGTVLGRHKGIINYTVGQRKGLGIALGSPAYVLRIDAQSDTVVLGPEKSLWRRDVRVKDLNWLSIPEPACGEPLKVFAKIRYQHRAAEAVLALQEDGTAELLFSEPVRAAAPGQAAVFYDGSGCVIGGGEIV